MLGNVDLFAANLPYFNVLDTKVSKIVLVDLLLMPRAYVVFGVGTVVGYRKREKRKFIFCAFVLKLEIAS